MCIALCYSMVTESGLQSAGRLLGHITNSVETLCGIPGFILSKKKKCDNMEQSLLYALQETARIDALEK